MLLFIALDDDPVERVILSARREPWLALDDAELRVERSRIQRSAGCGSPGTRGVGGTGGRYSVRDSGDRAYPSWASIVPSAASCSPRAMSASYGAQALRPRATMFA